MLSLEEARTVIVIDDEEGDLAVIEAILSDDYRVVCVDSGEAGLKALEEHPTAIVLCDQRMPTLTGDEVLARVRILYPDTVRVLVTGYSDVQAIIRSLNEGQIFGYLEKPFDPHSLRAMVERAASHQTMLLQSRRLLEENRRMRAAVDRMVNERTLALEAENQRLKDIALVDELTGIPNVRCLRVRLQEEYDRLLRTGQGFGVLLADIDGFKGVNDTWGHLAGDEVLKHVAGALTKTIRGADVAGRYGGEEFVVIAAGTSEAGAAIAAERLRAAVAAEAVEVAPGRTISVTISIGVAACVAGGAALEEILRRADEAMYHAKRTGKDRAVTWSQLKSSLGGKPSTFVRRI